MIRHLISDSSLQLVVSVCLCLRDFYMSNPYQSGYCTVSLFLFVCLYFGFVFQVVLLWYSCQSDCIQAFFLCPWSFIKRQFWIKFPQNSVLSATLWHHLNAQTMELLEPYSIGVTRTFSNLLEPSQTYSKLEYEAQSINEHF